MKFKLRKFLLIVGVSCMLTTPVMANVNLKIDGVFQNLELDSVMEEETLLVDAITLGTALGATTKYSQNSNEVTMKKDKKTVVMEVGSKEVIVNGAKLNLPVPAKKVERRIYVPARFVCEKMGAKVTWLPKSSTIVVTTNKKVDGILNLEKNHTEDTKVYTYERGLEYAIDQSSQLKNLSDTKKSLDDNLKNAKDAESQALNMNDKASEVRAKRLIKQIENEQSNVKENEKIIKDSIEISYRSNISSIISFEIDKQILNENIALQKINLKNTKLKHELGLESDFNLNQAKEKLKQSEAQLKSLDISIKNSKGTLNALLGFSAANDTYIEYKEKYEKISDNINSHIAIKTDGDPQVVVSNREIEYAKYVRDTTVYELNESKIKLDNDVLTLERKHSDMIATYDKNFRNTYNQLKQLEEARASLEIDINLAKETYNKAVLNFESGLITMQDVQSAKVNLLKFESDLEKNRLDYNNLKFSYDRPYLLK